jgi:putative ABC transport system permease protein
MLQDLRYGLRMLLKHKGFTAVAALTLALGIGANTAIFSVADAVLLRPLQYRDSERMVKLLGENRRRVSLALIREWKDQSRSFDEMVALWNNTSFRVTGQTAPEDIQGNLVSANIFSLLGVRAALGRTFLPDDERPDAEPVIILSHQYWVTQFSSAPDVIGRTITVDGRAHVIVGVLPSDFRETFEHIPGRAQIWKPAAFAPGAMSPPGRGPYIALARLKPGVSLEQASAEMKTIAERLSQTYPNSPRNVGAAIYSLHEEVTGNSRQMLFILMAAVGFVFLIACSNVASLLLARGVERSREIAIRAAIGAGRWRVARQLLTESTLLALLGGAFAFLLAQWILDAVVPLIPRDVQRIDGIAMNHRSLLFTLAVALFSSLLCGLLPAAQVSRIDLTEALKDSGYSASAGHRSRWWRSLLVVWQVSLTAVLLSGAALLTNSLIRLYRTDPGLDTRNLLSMSVSVSGAKGDQKGPGFWSLLTERALNLPGVQGVALVTPLPLGDSQYGMKVGYPSGAAIDHNETQSTHYNTVSHDYFRLLGVRLLRGRLFSDDDRAESQPVVIVNESLARTYFPGQEVIGQRLILNRGIKDEERVALIAGVVADSRARIDQQARPNLYLSLRQFPQLSMNLVARTSTDPEGYFGAMRDIVFSLDKNQPVGHLTTMDRIWRGYTVRPRFYLSLIGSLAFLAVLLAAAGIYGVLSHIVSQRVHEIGIRRALGARDADVLRLVIKQGMILALLGIAAGLGGALALARLMRGWLYEVGPNDPATFIAVAGLLILVALFACYAPARRAIKVDPLVALRHQ